MLNGSTPLRRSRRLRSTEPEEMPLAPGSHVVADRILTRSSKKKSYAHSSNRGTPDPDRLRIPDLSPIRVVNMGGATLNTAHDNINNNEMGIHIERDREREREKERERPTHETAPSGFGAGRALFNRDAGASQAQPLRDTFRPVSRQQEYLQQLRLNRQRGSSVAPPPTDLPHIDNDDDNLPSIFSRFHHRAARIDMVILAKRSFLSIGEMFGWGENGNTRNSVTSEPRRRHSERETMGETVSYLGAVKRFPTRVGRSAAHAVSQSFVGLLAGAKWVWNLDLLSLAFKIFLLCLLVGVLFNGRVMLLKGQDLAKHAQGLIRDTSSNILNMTMPDVITDASTLTTTTAKAEPIVSVFDHEKSLSDTELQRKIVQTVAEQILIIEKKHNEALESVLESIFGLKSAVVQHKVAHEEATASITGDVDRIKMVLDELSSLKGHVEKTPTPAVAISKEEFETETQRLEREMHNLRVMLQEIQDQLRTIEEEGDQFENIESRLRIVENRTNNIIDAENFVELVNGALMHSSILKDHINAATELENLQNRLTESANGLQGVIEKYRSLDKDIATTNHRLDNITLLSEGLRQEITDIKSESSASEPQDLRQYAKELLRQHDADKLGIPDYALKNTGGSIVPHMTSLSYGMNPLSAFFNIFPGKEPSEVLHADTSVGNCWAFGGVEGNITIKLSESIVPSAITIDHIPYALKRLDTAPKDFSVHSLANSRDVVGKSLGQFQYVFSPDADPVQTFPVKSDCPTRFVKIHITSNWGHDEFTSVYRIRIHGTPKAIPLTKKDPGPMDWIRELLHGSLK